MAGWPLHCRRHLRLVAVTSCATRSHEFAERTSGEKVLSTSAASSAVTQRILTCGAPGAPLMVGELVTLQRPCWMPSAQAEDAMAASSKAVRALRIIRTRWCAAGGELYTRGA